MTVTMPLSETICRPKAGTCCDQHAHQILKSLAYAVPEISWGD